MKRLLFFSIAGFWFLLHACQGKEKPTTAGRAAAHNDTVRTLSPKVILYRDSTVDFTARFIAGLPQLCDNVFRVAEAQSYWKNHRTRLNRNWQLLQTGRMDSLRVWQRDFFSTLIHDSLPVFYPFSGMDLLHPLMLYPHSRRYIFWSGDPVIKMPDLQHLNDDNRKIYLQSVENSLRDLFQQYYSVTTPFLSRDKTQGVLPMLEVMLVRSGFEILEMDRVALDSAGTLYYTLVDPQREGWAHGIRFSFRFPEAEELRELYYFSLDPSDRNLQAYQGLLVFMLRQGPVNTLLRATEYSTHYVAYTKLRNLILQLSASVFQDDTGIPLRYIAKNDSWQTVLFGQYDWPAEKHADIVYQPLLDSLYKTRRQEEDVYRIPFVPKSSVENRQLYLRQAP